MVCCYYENSAYGYVNENVTIYVSKHFYMPKTALRSVNKLTINKNDIQNNINKIKFIMTQKDLEKLFADSSENRDSRFSKVIDAFSFPFGLDMIILLGSFSSCFIISFLVMFNRLIITILAKLNKDFHTTKTKKLKKGDIVELTDLKGQTIQYSIYDIFVTDPNDVNLLLPKDEVVREVTQDCCQT